MNRATIATEERERVTLDGSTDDSQRQQRITGPLRRAVIALLICCLSLVFVPALAQQGAPEGTHTFPRTDGTFVVWRVVTDGDSDIWAMRVADNQAFPVAEGPAQVSDADVDGGIAVWAEWEGTAPCPACPARIVSRNLQTDETTIIAEDQIGATAPVISGTIVIWTAAPAENVPLVEVRAIDIATADAPVVLSEEAVPGVRAAIEGSRVVWMGASDDSSRPYQLVTARFGADDSPARVAFDVLVDPMTPTFDIGGGQIVYVTPNRDLIAVEIGSAARRVIASGNAQNPTTNGRFVFWDRLEPLSGDPLQRTLRGFDLREARAFELERGRFDHQPYLRDDTLVWRHGIPYDAPVPDQIRVGIAEELVPAETVPGAALLTDIAGLEVLLAIAIGLLIGTLTFIAIYHLGRDRTTQAAGTVEG
jgi:hypothetical protein